MVGERIYKKSDTSGNESFAGILFGNNGRRQDGDYGVASSLGTGHVKLNCPENSACRRGFSSPHEGGAQFLMGDGAVRLVSENIQHNKDFAINSLYEHLIAIQDGNPIGEF